MQTAIAILFVLACLAYVARQLMKTVRAGNGKAGTCCSHGCGGEPAATEKPIAPAIRTQFISSDSLRRRSPATTK